VLQMKYRTRTFYTDSQKALMWERWKEGATLHQIAKLFDRAHTSVQQILGTSGGIRPVERRRAEVALTLAEREEISRAVVAGRSIRTIAALLGRAASTISREIKRNGGQECIERARPTRPRGIEDIVPRSASWCRTGRWHAS
jgi:IS30 family transposase